MLEQFVRYCLVGLINTAVGLSLIYAAMIFLDLAPALANAAGFAVGLCVSYSLNKRWTFKSNAPTGRSFALFVGVVAIGYAANLAAVMAAIHGAGVNPYIAQLFGVGIYAVLVFLGSRYAAFRS